MDEMTTEQYRLEVAKLMLEAALQTRVLELCARHSWTLTYHTYDSRRSQRGFPDLVLVRPPRVIFAELKKEGEYLKPAQKPWRDALLACPGVEYYLWRPSDLPSIEEVLR